MTDSRTSYQAVAEAVSQLEDAAAAKKCWSCGCLQSSVETIERAIPEPQRPAELGRALRTARERFAEVQYECLGCKVCYPALAINALGRAYGDGSFEVDACPTESVEERPGWPPLPGSYTALRFRAPVAVCTLNDEALSEELAQSGSDALAIVGTMHTENLGIERLIRNAIANPNIRYLILCGADSRQAIGHLPGQSLLALAENGVDVRGRIIGARGKRPVLKNLSRGAVEHFRRTIAVVGSVGETDKEKLLDLALRYAAEAPGPATPFAPEQLVQPTKGYLPARMLPDPEGYFVVYLDRARCLLVLEHYRKDGALNSIIEGSTAAEVYWPAIERKLLSRLDHAAYLGRELARAEAALASGSVYIQDGAPEGAARSACACTSACGEMKQ